MYYLYLGLYENEIQKQLKQLQEIDNIIIKFGRDLYPTAIKDT